MKLQGEATEVGRPWLKFSLGVALVSLSLALCPTSNRAQGKDPPAAETAEKQADAALDWDRDFDLILESRQGADREAAFKGGKVADIEKELKRLRGEESEIRNLRKIFESNVMDETTYGELAKLGAGNCSEAMKMLDKKLLEIKYKVDDLEERIRRIRRGKG